MIEIYGRNNPDYEKNGDMTLFPEVCTVTAELNGAWYMDIIHPLDEEGRWKYITEEAVIAAPTFMGKKQLFRVDDMEKTDTEVTAKAYPVFFDSADDCFLFDVRPTGKNGQQALNKMTAGSKYSARSNITSGSTAYFVRRNLMDAINGEESPTFLERWGGEILFDNYTIIINEQVGADHGVEIRYGKNMAAVRYHVDMSQLVTRIVPVAFNGRTMSEMYVDSSNISRYVRVYTKEMRFENIKMEEDAEGSEEADVIICADQTELDTMLKEACMQQYASGIDLPAVTIEVDLVELSNTEEYKDFQELETIGLGDTVHCYNRILELSTAARAVKIVWDCIYNEIQTVTLGSYEQNYFTGLSSDAAKIERVVTEDGGLMAERVKGILNGMQTQLRLQNTVSEKQQVRAILFEDLDPESELYGALSIGTKGWEIADKRTADGRDWEWTTAATANGIVADAIITGLLADKLGRNFWNLDTGEFSLSSTVTVGGKTVESIARDTVDAQTQDDIFNKLTNDGKLKGIYMKEGELYINASYLKSGYLSADRIYGGTLTLGGSNNTNGLFQLLDVSGKEIVSGNKDGLSAVKGKIGGFTIDSTQIFGGDPNIGITALQLPSNNMNWAIAVGADSYESYGNAPFRVSKSGEMHAEKGEFSGTLKAAGGEFNGDITVNGFPESKYPIKLKNSSNAYFGIGGTGFLLAKNGQFIMLDYDETAWIPRLYGGTYSSINEETFALNNRDSDLYLDADGMFKSIWTRRHKTEDVANIHISSEGYFYRVSSSSRRYKTDESTELGDIKPENLYKLPVKVFRYKDGYLDESDSSEKKLIIGFIAEDVQEIFPEAVSFENGKPETWKERIMIPAMLKLIQEQNERIKKLEKEVYGNL